jgi:hypothetical protein
LLESVGVEEQRDAAVHFRGIEPSRGGGFGAGDLTWPSDARDGEGDESDERVTHSRHEYLTWS